MDYVSKLTQLAMTGVDHEYFINIVRSLEFAKAESSTKYYNYYNINNKQFYLFEKHKMSIYRYFSFTFL